MTLSSGPAARLTIYLRMNARWRHRSAYTEIVHRAQAAGLAGASVFRGDEGFGRSERIHTPHLLSLNGELPVAVVIVDEEQRLRGFLDQVQELLEGGVALLQPVEVIRFAGDAEERA